MYRMDQHSAGIGHGLLLERWILENECTSGVSSARAEGRSFTHLLSSMNVTVALICCTQQSPGGTKIVRYLSTLLLPLSTCTRVLLMPSSNESNRIPPTFILELHAAAISLKQSSLEYSAAIVRNDVQHRMILCAVCSPLCCKVL